MGIYDLMQGIQQQGEEGRKRGLAQLVGKAYAASPDQRQQILGTVAQRGAPDMAMEAQQGFDKQDDNAHLQMAKRAAEVVALYKSNPQMAQQVYQNGLLPIAARAGVNNAPPQLDDSLIEGLTRLASAAKGSDGTPAQQQYAEWLLSQVPEDQRDQTLGVLAGYKPRPSSAAIAYKEQVGEDGVTRMVAYDPRAVGAQVVGNGQTFGSGVGSAPAVSGPTRGDMEGDIQLANAMISAGIPAEQVDSFLAARGQRAESMPANNVQAAPQASGGANPFQSRPQEQQKYLDEQAQQAAQIGTLPMRGQIEAQNAGLKENATQASQLRFAGQKKAAEFAAERRSKALADLPVTMQTSQQTIDVIDKALNHPGLSIATGLSSKIDPRNLVPGQPGYDFGVVMDQLKGKAFLEAFATLKGGGQITEVEGKKATDAIARLNTAQSEPEFKQSLRELRQIAKNAQERAIRLAQGQQPVQQGGGVDDLLSKYGVK